MRVGVDLAKGRDTLCATFVDGQQTYTAIYEDGSKDCTCPAFKKSGKCKHLDLIDVIAGEDDGP